MAFHDEGYSVYEPGHCHVQHVVTGDFDAFKTRPHHGRDDTPWLCEQNGSCSWGGAVNVKNKFIYVTQPKLNRVVVIEISDRFNPIEARTDLTVSWLKSNKA